MMNNYDEKTLLNKIKELENENAKLQLEKDELRKKHEIQEVVDIDYSKPVSLNDYYLSKYIETHDEIFSKRYQNISNEKQKLESELTEQKELLTNLQSNDNDRSIEDIEAEIAELTFRKEDLDKLLEEKVIELNDLIKKINGKLVQAKAYVDEYYGNLVKHLGKASNESTLEYMDFVLSVVKNSFYDQNVEINDEMIKATYLNRNLEDLDKKIEIEKNEIDERIKAISDLSIKEKISACESKIEELEVSLKNNKQVEEELIQLFKEIKQKHIKEIFNQISYMQIRDAENKEIANVLEELIEVDFAQMLETIDTETNALLKKEMEVKSLKLRKAQLSKVEEEYEEFVKEVSNLESMFNSINQNIKQIEEYVSFAMKAIESHSTYTKVCDEYTTLLTKKEVLEKDIETLSDELILLKEQRKEKVLDPYARVLINELNENIALRESKIDRSKTLLEKVIDEINTFANTKEEIVLVNVINEKIKCEKHLPYLYKKQHSLMLIVEEKQEQLQKIKKELDEYNSLEDKLGEMLDENNN